MPTLLNKEMPMSKKIQYAVRVAAYKTEFWTEVYASSLYRAKTMATEYASLISPESAIEIYEPKSHKLYASKTSSSKWTLH